MLSQFMPQWINDLLAKYGVVNIAGSITAILAGAIYVADTYLGCNIGAVTADPNVAISTTCSLPSWFPASWAPATLGLAAAVAFLGKLFRPGGLLRSFFGGTAVIVDPKNANSTIGTATPADVAKP